MTQNLSELRPPTAKKIPRKLEIHGQTLQDPYFWLRDKENPEVLDYLNAENTYTDAVMKHTEGFQEKLYQEILARIKETDLSVPVKVDDYFYYTRTEKGKQYAIACRKKFTLEASEEILLDMNELARDKSYFSLGGFAVSPNHRLLAYSTDTDGSELFTIFIKDLETGQQFSETISHCATGIEWAKDNQTFFYTVQDETKRPFKVFRHHLGEDPLKDELIFHEKDQAFVASLSTSKSKKYIFLNTSSSTTTEVYLIQTENPKAIPHRVCLREHKHEYALAHHGNQFFIMTNEKEAVNFKLMAAPETRPDRELWKELLPHRPEIKIEGIEAFEKYLVLYEREKGLMKIRITEVETDQTHYLDFPEPVYTAWGGNNPNYDSEILRFGYTSLVTPSTVYDYHIKTRVKELKKQAEVLGGYDPSLYISERIYAPSHDGVRVPVSLVYRRDLDRSKPHPLFLYGYGSYGISIDPEFSSVRLSLLDRGFIYAIAHVRGGGDLGKPWHKQGKLLKKKNTFLDFTACTQFLIREKYTSSKQVVIYGGSAGGLLIGNVINEYPELFLAAIAKVPFVDIISTMLDQSLPLTVGEFEEWGNPEEKEYFEYMLSYSPYDNVKAQTYPHLLITTGLNDPRVQYWEPAKWTAKLRHLKKDNEKLLFKINMGTGHGGASGRYDHLREIALDYAFILDQFGIFQ